MQKKTKQHWYETVRVVHLTTNTIGIWKCNVASSLNNISAADTCCEFDSNFLISIEKQSVPQCLLSEETCYVILCKSLAGVIILGILGIHHNGIMVCSLFVCSVRTHLSSTRQMLFSIITSQVWHTLNTNTNIHTPTRVLALGKHLHPLILIIS